MGVHQRREDGRPWQINGNGAGTFMDLGIQLAAKTRNCDAPQAYLPQTTPQSTVECESGYVISTFGVGSSMQTSNPG